MIIRAGSAFVWVDLHFLLMVIVIGGCTLGAGLNFLDFVIVRLEDAVLRIDFALCDLLLLVLMRFILVMAIRLRGVVRDASLSFQRFCLVLVGISCGHSSFNLSKRRLFHL